MTEIIDNILNDIDNKYCIKCKSNTKCYGYKKPEYCWFCKKEDMRNIIINVRDKTLTNLFISEFIKVHGDKYCYDYFNYTNNITASTIICKYHGVFLQTPKNHKIG